ncbi:MAG: 23S rRNA (pseudouridine(1915)-N(3))-methyltransferase RlmH [Pseudomonadales bacterium]|jgi:23S rRNA (pseudouridine1915-N3)-methyltransferase
MRVIAVGQRPPAWVESGFDDYARRLPRELALILKEIPVASRRALPIERARRQEGERICAELAARDWVVALDVEGRMQTTSGLAERLGHWMEQGRDVAFLIGGPDGLDPICTARADERLSLSALTFPHGLVRVMLAEQLYRAWTVRAGHPYHRA